MSEKTLAQKFMLKPGMTILLVDPPAGYLDWLGDLPENARIVTAADAPVDVIQFFVPNRQALETQLPRLKILLKPGGSLWVIYYKGTASVRTDIHRDSINAYGQSQGLRGVFMISVNSDWSALRMLAVE